MSETSKSDDKDRCLTLEEHIALRAHLDVLRKTVEEFCIAEGYSDVTTGRYPRIRLQKPEESETDEFLRSIDLWMTFDDCEGYRKTFTPDVPYDLFAGASLRYQLGDSGVQHGKFIAIWKDKPFCEITPQNYMEAMKQAADEIRRWDRAKMI